MCEWKPDFDALNARVTTIEGRMSQVEHDLGMMRSETQAGFRNGAEAMREINVSVSNLAHDFGARMNTIDKRLVEEKQKWGETLRSVVVWSVRVLLAGAALAMGITAWRTLVQ